MPSMNESGQAAGRRMSPRGQFGGAVDSGPCSPSASDQSGQGRRMGRQAWGKGYRHSNSCGQRGSGTSFISWATQHLNCVWALGSVRMGAEPPACSHSPPALPSWPLPHSALRVPEHGGCKTLGHSHQTGSIHLHQEIVHLDPRGGDTG